MKRDGFLTFLPWAAPWLAGFMLFTALPVGLGIWYAFTDYTLLEPPIMVGTKNFARLVDDPILGTVAWNTFFFGLLSIVVGTVLSIALAVLLSKPARFQAFWLGRLVPSVLPLIAVAAIFKLGFDGELGAANQLLGLIGVEGPNWFGSGAWAWTALLMMSLGGVGPAVVIYLAGLRDVPKQLHEAASLDGVGSWGRFVHVTLPMISPVILFNVVIGIINAAQVFVIPLVMTGGGPGRSTYLQCMSMTKRSNTATWDMPVLGLVQFAAILVLTGLVLLLGQRFVYYRGLMERVRTTLVYVLLTLVTAVALFHWVHAADRRGRR